jgi:hypothetical protein
LLIAYSSLSVINFLPPLYFGSMPNGYLKVLHQAGEGKTENDPVSKRTDPKAFEKAYKDFVRGK